MVSIHEESLSWHEWLCKSNFSFLTGSSHPHELIRQAWSLGYRSLCLNDYDGVYGLARAYRALQDLRKKEPGAAAFRLNYGAEVHLQKDHSVPLLLQSTLVLIAMNWSGYQQLCHILTLSHTESKSEAYISLQQLLQQDVSGIAAIQPMRGFIRSQHSSGYLGVLQDHFQNRLYLGISRHLHPAEDLWIPDTMQAARYLQAPCLLTQDAFFHSPERKPLNDLLHSIRHNIPVQEAGHYFFPNSERCFRPLSVLHARYRELPVYRSAMESSSLLADNCRFCLSGLRYHYPREMIPEGFTAQKWLCHQTWKGARAHFGSHIPEKIQKTLQHELALIRQLEFADYFLTVWDIVCWARSRSILCQGRGSAANSAVCFVLGITSVDPASFDLLFERFISMERGDPPDIDVDFEHERREEVISYIYERYGRDRAAMVANVITFRRKGALRAAGKALGVPEPVLSQASSLAGQRNARSQDMTAILTHLREQNSGEQVPWTLWEHMTALLRGFPRHLGIHSGGFMISERSLNWLLPQEPATMPGRTVIQWCKEDIEALGFFKIDILALGMLTAVRKTLQELQHVHGITMQLHQIPPHDSLTWKMIQEADTVGTFQIESRAQMSMLPRLRPRSFYDLVIQIAIIRPGPLQGKVIHPFLRRRNGLEPVTYPSEALKPVLERTLGVAIFQEQAMRIAIAVGNFTPGEANELRKNIGAWSIKNYERDLNPWLQKLAHGMTQNGFDQGFIRQILGQMRGFADYGFPESHAASFARIAWASAWLKCHYPALFFTSLLNSQPVGFYSPHSLLKAAERCGAPSLPLCVNRSGEDCQVEPIPASPGEGAPSWGIRLGFRLITGLSKNGIRHLLNIRKKEGGMFHSQHHFFRKVRMSRPDLTSLAAAKALECFSLGRQEAVWLSEAAPFTWIPEAPENPLEWRQEDPWTAMQKDFRAFRTSLGTHPAALVREQFWPYDIPVSSLSLLPSLAKAPGGLPVTVFGLIMVRQAPPSANGMVFLTLEDTDGFINLACPPPVWQKFHNEVEGQSFLCVRGRLQKVNESHSVLIREVLARRQIMADIHQVREKAPPQTLSPFHARGGRGFRRKG